MTAKHGSPTDAAWSRFGQIQDFKQSRAAEIDGVNYANVVALYLYDVSLVARLKQIVFSLFFATRISTTGGGSKVLLFYSHRYRGRSDYDYIAEKLVEVAGSRATSAESTEAFSLAQPFRTTRHLGLGWRASGGLRGGLTQRFSTALLIAKFVSTARPLFKVLACGRSRVVTFCDAAPHDNLLAQIASLQGAATITAQHGQYRLLDESNMSPDAEAYANFVSDQLLCWGEATRAEFARYGVDPKRLVVTGWIRHWERSLQPRPKVGTFGVMLNGENGEASNAGLIDTANQVAAALNYTFVIRLHPAFTPARYQALVDDSCVAMSRISASEYLSTVDFSIAHMSGAVIEMLHVGSPIYVFDDGRLAEAFKRPGLSYPTVRDMIAAIKDDISNHESTTSPIARQHQLATWYNDDTEQLARIRSVILAGEA